MRNTYTVAAVPSDVASRTALPAVPLPVKIPYTLADAEEIAKRYNENPIYKGILRNNRYNHFVAFDIEAMTIEPNEYLLRAMLSSKERGEVLASHYMQEAISYNKMLDEWYNRA